MKGSYKRGTEYERKNEGSERYEALKEGRGRKGKGEVKVSESQWRKTLEEKGARQERRERREQKKNKTSGSGVRRQVRNKRKGKETKMRNRGRRGIRRGKGEERDRHEGEQQNITVRSKTGSLGGE